jgi:5-methyltetrahydropteroyltriglutamate--homocysteine methyltransferase
LDWAVPAFRLTAAAVQPTTQIHTHMCYSEFQDIIKAIDALDADVISFEAARADLTLLDVLHDTHFETHVGPGVYDIHSPRVPSVDEIVAIIHKILARIPLKNVWINPDCGLKTREEPETIASLKNMTAAVQEVREELHESQPTV